MKTLNAGKAPYLAIRSHPHTIAPPHAEEHFPEPDNMNGGCRWHELEKAELTGIWPQVVNGPERPGSVVVKHGGSESGFTLHVLPRP